MRPLSSTEAAPVTFRPKEGESSHWFKSPTGKIGWIRTQANRAGAKFDIVIKDALGREKFRREGCHSEVQEFGEYVGVPAQLGEDLEVQIENIQGAEEIRLHIN